jgi:hypothetical protein
MPAKSIRAIKYLGYLSNVNKDPFENCCAYSDKKETWYFAVHCSR